MPRFACDPHTHTIWSRHAYSTVEENVRAAANRGLELIGITEHYAALVHPTLDIRDFQYFLNFEVWPETWHGVRLLHGAEADIVDVEGHLFGWDTAITRGLTGARVRREQTLKECVFEGCDYVIASIHNKDFTLDESIVANTQMYLNALADPKVLMLGHIGRSGVEFDFDEVIKAARDCGKLIEINEHSHHGHLKGDSVARCRTIAERCAELGCMVAVSSDAHISCAVGDFTSVEALLDEIHFPEELVVTRDSETFLNVVKSVVV